MAKTLTIILGAGASRDLIGNRTAQVQDQYTPPLSSDLFTAASQDYPVDWGAHGEMAQAILEQYPRAKAAAATLGLRGRQALEAAMKEMQTSSERHVRRQFVQVPVYLRHLFWDISHTYTTLPVNYVNLLNRVIGSDFERVGLITTNYDTFLEDSLSSLLDAEFSRLESYIADQKWALVKLHGSINWARRIGGFDPPGGNPDKYLRQLDDLTLGDKDGVVGRLGSLQIWDNPELWDDKGPMYPALVVPVEGKYEYLCPDHHVDVARDFIRNSYNFLIIGSSGLDDDLMDLLSESGHLALTLGVVSHGDAQEVLKRFQQVPMFKGPQVLTRVVNNGFSRFITDGDLTEFLRALYDDANRDAWSEAKSRAAQPQPK